MRNDVNKLIGSLRKADNYPKEPKLQREFRRSPQKFAPPISKSGFSHVVPSPFKSPFVLSGDTGTEVATSSKFVKKNNKKEEVINPSTIDTYGLEFKFAKQRDDVSCDPNSVTACAGKNQACLQNPDGIYRCGCDQTSTFVNGTCIELVNECSDSNLNTCDPAAICMDSALGYECLCNEGYLDLSKEPQIRPGRKCVKLINECASKNGCDPNAKCIDKPIGYACRCSSGYVDVSPEGARNPGKKCIKAVDECSDKTLNDCDPNAICRDEMVGFSCRCKFGFADMSKDPEKPGRLCTLLSLDCRGCNSTTSQCVPTKTGNLVCACLPGYVDLNPMSPGQNCSKESSGGQGTSKGSEDEIIQISQLGPEKLGDFAPGSLIHS
ncbi:hypothetical protein WR25_12214 [Diploscapter pachys]|uniref:EGF-like domain-containing protein n=1 Tax=Diploscapter pachys TaxID=2018661 RepID=A0A2A2LWM1_9BILA|nr:hypothetical protein WR25_12214 [Diploscapter pachys]